MPTLTPALAGSTIAVNAAPANAAAAASLVDVFIDFLIVNLLKHKI
jgi:hypothetical protein